MNQRDILYRLIPQNQPNPTKWKYVIGAFNGNTSWYPSSGLDFKDILFFNIRGINTTEVKPSIFIHSDLSYKNISEFIPFIDEFNKDYGIKVRINDVIELSYSKNKQISPTLINVTVSHGDNEYRNNNILFFFNDNLDVIEKFILPEKVQLTHIFCHLSQGFQKHELIESLNPKVGVKFLISDKKLSLYIDELDNNEEVVLKDNLRLNLITTLSLTPFVSEIKIFNISR